MLTEGQWTELKAGNPALMEKIRRDLSDLAGGRCGWAEVLGIGDAELLGMAKAAASKLEHGRGSEAEQMFRALTELDPYVSWFWMSLGDARARLGKDPEAVEAYGRCIQEAGRMRPPSNEEIRTASLRRGRLHVRMQGWWAAYEDFRKVLELDTASVLDGEQALLAIEALVAEGKLPATFLLGLPARSARRDS